MQQLNNYSFLLSGLELTTLSEYKGCAANNELWSTEIKENQELVRQRKRQLSYYANIYVVSDPKNPDAEGKVFLYRFGKKIFDKVMEAMTPEFDDETPLNPFDFWEGANFKIKIRKVEGYRNYDKSEFASPSALLDDDTELEEIWKKQYKLQELLSEKEFKSTEELTKSFNRVLGNASTPAQQATKEADELEDDFAPAADTPRQSAKPSAPAVADDDDDDMAAYRALLND